MKQPLQRSSIESYKQYSATAQLSLRKSFDAVARRIGRTGNAIEEDIRGLVNLGILKTRRVGRSEVLLLDRERDREVLDAIAKHLRNLEGVEKIDHTKF